MLGWGRKDSWRSGVRRSLGGNAASGSLPGRVVIEAIGLPGLAGAVGGATLVLSLAGVWLSLLLSRKKNLLAIPNERSSHVVPTPSGGGAGMALAVVLTLPLAAWLGQAAQLAWFMVTVTLSSVVGFWDDRRPLGVRTRLIVLVVASVPVVAVGYADMIRLPFLEPFSLGFLALPLSLLWLVGFANVFNFMDGIDGIAGLTAGISGLGFAIAGLLAQDPETALLGAAAAGAAFGFLPWNFPRAKIFMGDAGSLPLGLLLAGTALVAARQREEGAAVVLSFPACVLILGPFLFDAILTLIRRGLHGKRIGEAHREHLYQRLSRQWGSHTPVSLLYGSFAILTVGQALLYDRIGELPRLLSLSLSLVGMSLFAQVVLARDRRATTPPP